MVSGNNINSYFNGVKDSVTGTLTGGLTSGNEDLFIGARNLNGVTDGMFMIGSMDEVAIFNTALSDEKITQIYDATAVVGGVPQTANLFTGGLSSSLVYWNRMGDS